VVCLCCAVVSLLLLVLVAAGAGAAAAAAGAAGAGAVCVENQMRRDLTGLHSRTPNAPETGVVGPSHAFGGRESSRVEIGISRVDGVRVEWPRRALCLAGLCSALLCSALLGLAWLGLASLD